MWGATVKISLSQIIKRFQSTHPCGVRPNSNSWTLAKSAFQSTHPCGVRQVVSTSKRPVFCFNPRTRVGCDKGTVSSFSLCAVSIHAPVWGATSERDSVWDTHSFNPRTRVGCDYQGFHKIILNQVSIHAPVWGATSLTCVHIWKKSFQSTHPCGVRLNNLSYDCNDDRFQSTHPCGVRLEPLSALYEPPAFQSTHPCGVRHQHW